MGRSLTIVILTAIIVALLMPLTLEFCAYDPAFTPDNLITLHKTNN